MKQHAPGLLIVGFICASTPVLALDDLRLLLNQSRKADSLEEDATRFKGYFDRRDVDGIDGLSEADRRVFLAQEIERFRSQARERFERHDLDGDGVATLEEIDTVARKDLGYGPAEVLTASEQRRVDTLKRLFNRCDLDEDGVITEAECLAEEEEDIDRMVAFNERVFDAFLNGLDRDGDGIVLFEDVEAGLAILWKNR